MTDAGSGGRRGTQHCSGSGVQTLSSVVCDGVLDDRSVASVAHRWREIWRKQSGLRRRVRLGVKCGGDDVDVVVSPFVVGMCPPSVSVLCVDVEPQKAVGGMCVLDDTTRR